MMLGIPIFLALLIVKKIIVYSESSCQPFAVKTENLNKRSVGHLLYETKVPALFPCMIECVRRGACKSINFIQKEQTCQLNDNSKSVLQADIIEVKGSVFVDKTEFPQGIAGPCSSHTCTDIQRCIPMGSTFVCETLECSTGWTYYEGLCYFNGQRNMNYSDAEMFCSKLGARTVTLDTASRNGFMRSFVKAGEKTGEEQRMYMDIKMNNIHVGRSPRHHWIGLKDEIVEGKWRWQSNGALVSFTYWTPGQPSGRKSENCAVLVPSSNYKWYDIVCTALCNPLCEKRNI